MGFFLFVWFFQEPYVWWNPLTSFGRCYYFHLVGFLILSIQMVISNIVIVRNVWYNLSRILLTLFNFRKIRLSARERLFFSFFFSISTNLCALALFLTQVKDVLTVCMLIPFLVIKYLHRDRLLLRFIYHEICVLGFISPVVRITPFWY